MFMPSLYFSKSQEKLYQTSFTFEVNIQSGEFYSNVYTFAPLNPCVYHFMPPANPIYRSHSVRLSGQISCNSSLTDEQILKKLYIFPVSDLRMCIKEYNPSLNYFKGDN